MTHLSREELMQWHDQGRADDRDRVVSHLAACRSCAAEYADLIRTAPALESPTHFNPADFVARGYAVRRETSRASLRMGLSWKVWAGALGAAAALLLVVTLGPNDDGGTRGGGVQITLPTEVTDQPSVVEWTTGLAVTRFRVELVDEAGATIFQTVTETPRAVLPDSDVMKLAPGRSYTWRITALDREGESLTTASKTFAIGTGAR